MCSSFDDHIIMHANAQAPLMIIAHSQLGARSGVDLGEFNRLYRNTYVIRNYKISFSISLICKFREIRAEKNKTLIELHSAFAHSSNMLVNYLIVHHIDTLFFPFNKQTSVYDELLLGLPLVLCKRP